MLEGKKKVDVVYKYAIPVVILTTFETIRPISMPFQRNCVKCMISWIRTFIHNVTFFNCFNLLIFDSFTIFISQVSLRCCLSNEGYCFEFLFFNLNFSIPDDFVWNQYKENINEHDELNLILLFYHLVYSLRFIIF